MRWSACAVCNYCNGSNRRKERETKLTVLCFRQSNIKPISSDGSFFTADAYFVGQHRLVTHAHHLFSVIVFHPHVIKIQAFFERVVFFQILGQTSLLLQISPSTWRAVFLQ